MSAQVWITLGIVAGAVLRAFDALIRRFWPFG